MLECDGLYFDLTELGFNEPPNGMAQAQWRGREDSIA
jgi:hypothetical protein